MAGLAGDEYEAQWQAWLAASVKVQAAITAYADAAPANRYDVEQAVKRAARGAEQDPAE